MSNYTNNWQTASAQSAHIGTTLQAASQNTISLGSLNGASGSIDIAWESLSSGYNTNVKKYEIYEISQDILALSVCWSRLRKQRQNDTTGKIFINISKLIDSELFRHLNEDDIAQANVIRDYYSKKIMVWKLKNIKLTPFREDLNTFIHGDGKIVREVMMPLVYRLPEFYEYDVEFEKMSFDYNKEIKKISTPNKELKFVKKLFVNNKRMKRNEYWFSDNNNNLINFNIEASNPLISLLDVTLNKGDFTLDGPYKRLNRDGVEYLKIDKIKFV